MSDSIFEEDSPRAKPAPQPAPAPAKAAAAAPAMEVEFEDSAPAASAPSAAPSAAVPEDPAFQAECDRVQALVGGAIAQRRWVDLWALALAGLCGHGLGALTRIQEWSGGVVLGLLAVVCGILLSAWMWNRVRTPAAELETLPVPNPASLRGRPMDAAQLAAARQRQQDDAASIDLCAAQLESLRGRLRWAVLAACVGAPVGWLAGILGQPGAGLLAGSVGASVAAVGGWNWRAQGWSPKRVRLHLAGIVPASAMVIAFLAGTNILWAIAGAVLAGGGVIVVLRKFPPT